jgi:hypothetical protein
MRFLRIKSCNICVDQSTRYGNSGRFWHLAGSSVFVMLIGEAQRFIWRTKEFAAS